jgi:hypothetical protein
MIIAELQVVNGLATLRAQMKKADGGTIGLAVLAKPTSCAAAAGR